MHTLSSLPNIGKILEQQLVQIGIETPEQLKEAGSKQTWLRIKEIDPSACYNRLCALEGAVQGIRWHNLDDTRKEELKAFYNQENPKA